MSTKPLRVAITHTRYSYTGGIEKYIHSLVERLLDAGHEVHYLAHRWEERDHPRLHFHKVNMIRFPHSLRVLSFNAGCNRIIARENFDLVHGFTKTDTQDIYTDGSGCLLDYIDATLAHRPAWYRALHLWKPHQRAIALMERRRFRDGATFAVIPMAKFVRDQIVARHPLDPERLEVVYNGVEVSHFHPEHRAGIGAQLRAEHGISDDTPVLVFVGNDWFRKGLETALEALARMKVSGKPPVLLVCGHDNHPGTYRTLARRLGVEDRVRWLGPVKEILGPFAAADVFVFPTRYDVFGNVGLEALACGVPSVLSSKSGVSEVLDDPEAGRVLDDPYDADALARHTEALLKPDHIERRRKAARALAERYSWDEHFRRILEIYDEVLTEKRSLS